MKRVKVGVVALGCDKNLVDTNYALARLSRSFNITHPEEAEIVVISTCAFIKPAVKESLNEINYWIQRGKKVFVIGCLPQRFPDASLPEGVAWVGVNGFSQLDQLLLKFIKEESLKIVEPTPRFLPTFYSGKSFSPWVVNPPTAFVKISDGCNKACTYCTIKKIRGKLRRRSPDDILREVEFLISKGVKEIILVAQDLLSWKWKNMNFAELLRKISQTGVSWIRPMYIDPADFTDEILDSYTPSNVLKYFDLAFQHASGPVLKRMGRRGDFEVFLEVIQKIRRAFPYAVFRSTFIVGFPGEKEEDFLRLIEFLKLAALDWAGVFPYYDERDASSFWLDEKVDYRTKMKRVSIFKKIQREITKKKLKQKIGSIQELIVTGHKRGRFWFQSPEDGGAVLTFKAAAGEIIKCRISRLRGYSPVGAKC